MKQELAASIVTDLLFEEPGLGRCLVAPDGTILRANREWLRSTGFTGDEVLGADIVELFPGGDGFCSRTALSTGPRPSAAAPRPIFVLADAS